MQRWALGVEYDGTRYAGFQRQSHHTLATVQGDLEQALSSIANHAISVFCAGRTDAGVHATGQVVHFETEAERPPKAWQRGGNSLTGDGLSIHWACRVPDDFHARFSARWRSYLYVMSDGRRPGALLSDRVTYLPEQLDAERMDLAARHLLGEQDFTSFRAAGCQARHAMREVQQVRVHRRGPLLGFEIRANAFLQHMVRNIVGSLVLVGTGVRSPDWIATLLAARDRTLAGPAAPASGLYLTGVGYPDHPTLPLSDVPGVMPWCLVSADASPSPGFC